MGFFDGLAGSIVGGVASAFGASSSNKAAMKQQEAANKANRELAEYQAQQNRLLAEYQNSWNKQMWNETNEYNSPTAQMARYQDAGLNPNLIYGQGTPGNAGSLTSSTAGEYTAPKMGAFTNFRDPISTGINTFLASA